MKEVKSTCEGFTEVTLFDGDSEVMAHKTAQGWARVYAYKADVDGGAFSASWEWKAGLNPVFVHLVSPAPSVAVNSLRQRGFMTMD